jgi:hypothetical protein
MTQELMGNPFVLVGGAVVAYGLLVHFWPSIKSKLPFVSDRISRELDRESADLDNFVKNAHVAIDKEIADLQEKKQKIADTAAAVKKLVE